jgi:hypothetical protein
VLYHIPIGTLVVQFLEPSKDVLFAVDDNLDFIPAYTAHGEDIRSRHIVNPIIQAMRHYPLPSTLLISFLMRSSLALRSLSLATSEGDIVVGIVVDIRDKDIPNAAINCYYLLNIPIDVKLESIDYAINPSYHFLIHCAVR